MQRAARAILLIAPVVFVIFCNSPSEPPRLERIPQGMKIIDGGTFTMGSADTINKDAQPVRTVTVGSFYMDSVEVTQLAYFDLMGFNPTTYYPCRYDYYPVDSITWYDAVLCANARSKRDHFDTVYSYAAAHLRITLSNTNAIEAIRCTTLTGLSCDLRKRGYRLPTEAEWEYACRAGTTTVNYWGDDLADSIVARYAWFDYNSSDRLNLVAWKKPNDWGISDMIGNVWEWCNDWYAEGYPATGADVNPGGPATGTERVIRGGGQNSLGSDGSLRSASRQKDSPEKYRFNRGFRLVIPK
jgi:formylglycine-generating enzyme required for sulfatase activity